MMLDDVMIIENGCVSLSERNATVSCTDAIGKVMEWFSKLFGRSGKAKRDFPNLTRGKDPLELWNKTGELGDGAFGKVYKVCGSIVVSVCASRPCNAANSLQISSVVPFRARATESTRLQPISWVLYI